MSSDPPDHQRDMSESLGQIASSLNDIADTLLDAIPPTRGPSTICSVCKVKLPHRSYLEMFTEAWGYKQRIPLCPKHFEAVRLLVKKYAMDYAAPTQTKDRTEDEEA